MKAHRFLPALVSAAVATALPLAVASSSAHAATAAPKSNGQSTDLYLVPTPGDNPRAVTAALRLVGWPARVHYSVDFGDGSSPSTGTAPAVPPPGQDWADLNVTHVYPAVGTYRPVATITDDAGHSTVSRPAGGDYDYLTIGSGYNPVTPRRVLDTGTPVPAYGEVTLQVTGVGTVPADGAAAVVLNTTVTAGTHAGYATAYPHGTARPNTSTLNWAAGQTVANQATVPLVDGKVTFYNHSSGTVRIIADLAGYYSPASGYRLRHDTFGYDKHILDTRSRVGVRTRTAVPAHGQVTVTIPGGYAAVGLNVTVTGARRAGFLDVYAHGTARPSTSTLNWAAGQTIANGATVRLADRKVTFYNHSSGSVHVIADLIAIYAPDGTDGFRPTALTRVLDTGKPIAPKAGFLVAVPNGMDSNGNVLVDGGAYNVTVTRAAAAGLLATQQASYQGWFSEINWAKGQTVANGVASDAYGGELSGTNLSAGPVRVIVDAAGYFYPLTPYQLD